MARSNGGVYKKSPKRQVERIFRQSQHLGSSKLVAWIPNPNNPRSTQRVFLSAVQKEAKAEIARRLFPPSGVQV
ncbi:MAG: hypothetical protein AAB629_02295 [Patescibacteria group bacterium]